MRRMWLCAGLVMACSGSASDGGEDATGSSSTTGGASDVATGGSSEATSEDTTVTPTTGASMAGTTGETTTGETTSMTGEDTGTASGGCGQDPGFVGAMDQSIMVGDQGRKYILALPDGYDPDTAYPLVFAWHGRGGSGGLARLYFKIEEASNGQAIFVYPDGLPLADMADQTGWDLDPNAEDFALFDAMYADLSARLCVDAERVYSTGHSFGAYMSNQLGCFRGDVLRAIGGVAGGGPFGDCTGQVATWLAHGTGDQVVAFSQGEASRDTWKAANHCEDQADPVEPAPCTAFAGCDEGHPVVWCAHDEPDLSGHGWPLWAPGAIWKFFAQF